MSDKEKSINLFNFIEEAISNEENNTVIDNKQENHDKKEFKIEPRRVLKRGIEVVANKKDEKEIFIKSKSDNVENEKKIIDVNIKAELNIKHKDLSEIKKEDLLIKKKEFNNVPLRENINVEKDLILNNMLKNKEKNVNFRKIEVSKDIIFSENKPEKNKDILANISIIIIVAILGAYSYSVSSFF